MTVREPTAGRHAPPDWWSGRRRLRVAHGFVDPLADDLARATGRHRDAVQDVARLHRALLVRDDHELRLAPELVDEVEKAVQVDVVERGLDLVEEVERRRP